ncbi:hypothetical protein NUU61_005049 [Penicillium alfredii]|uniref:ASST-domain-containing protein n=1 Tax=Penicillium alfredii TaxID=1506179 RepID=A0A9W9F8U1_9EURO|nr:uncharacterized protein NUU61_005049 [Penicillium alfredii]KAJ5095693.1 hypothetical protein NUU61_005049 [Penicillium alfredii]
MIAWAFLALLFLSSATALEPFRDDDLIEYVTLPGHRALKWNVDYYNRSAVAPGYWFVAPYWNFHGEKGTNQWMPYQIGPYIYDQDGELVWSGAALWGNRNAMDFKVFTNLGNKPLLAWQIPRAEGDSDTAPGYILTYDEQYQKVHQLDRPAPGLDTHEFKVKENPWALITQYRTQSTNLKDFGGPDKTMDIDFSGFVEIDMNTGEQMMDWYSYDISIEESYTTDMNEENPSSDYLHMNSIDRNSNGDFLISGRHTDAVYLISHEDGRILWRLGGKKSDFHQDFHFSRQHDAQFMSTSDSEMILSVMNNGADTFSTEKPTSTGMYIKLDLTTMNATLLAEYPRPDGGCTDYRGNMQTLPNSNIFMGWSWAGMISEHTPGGTLLMNASFASDRYGTYRSFKLPWTGRPLDPPTLVSSCHGVNGSKLSTVFHVSWNGATDVAHWRFYARATAQAWKREIGTVPKHGFETSFTAPGYMDWVSVEALDANQNVLGSSLDVRTSPPEYWPANATAPQPDNPEALSRPPSASSLRQKITQSLNWMVVFFAAGFLTNSVVSALVVYRRNIRSCFWRMGHKAQKFAYRELDHYENWDDSGSLNEEELGLLKDGTH